MDAKIFRHDNRPASDLDSSHAGPSIPRTAASGPGTTASAATVTDLARHRAAPSRATPPPISQSASFRLGQPPAAAAPGEMPPVILRLPDVSADIDVASGRMFDLSNLLSWVGISLGAVVAVVLIWSGPNVARQDFDRDTAPAGSVPAPDAKSHKAHLEAQPGGTPTNPDESTETPGESESEPAHSRGGRLPSRRRALQATAAADPQSPVLTARGADTTWDGSVSMARPGEAAPVGRIMNVTVPQ
jgi:hypothetical protein